MRYTGKLVGGLLGLVFGPVGALAGVLLGHQVDEHLDKQDALPPPPGPEELAAIGERFFRATFRVMGYLAKADGRVSEQEISAARAVMAELRLDAARVQQAIECFTAGKQPGFDLAAELTGIGRACAGRPDLLRVFVEIQVRAALRGNNLDGPVRPLLNRVASRLGVSPFELAQIEAVLRIRGGTFHYAHAGAEPRISESEKLAQAYKVLEAAPGDSDQDVVKAYRRQLSRHHPDKLKANGLPDSMIEHAKQRTQQIIEAYELIRERRGI
ncbi:MAG TPA: co-chaperone DjlA [Steroidobacteraceae bacterium]|nr:co-chaperone DjlA [Steroidobacteraceae bacterium]